MNFKNYRKNILVALLSLYRQKSRQQLFRPVLILSMLILVGSYPPSTPDVDIVIKYGPMLKKFFSFQLSVLDFTLAN